MLAGGGAPETEVNLKLSQFASTLSGVQSHCVKLFADAMEIIPFTLAENAGLSPINIVTELRNKHAQGEAMAGKDRQNFFSLFYLVKIGKIKNTPIRALVMTLDHAMTLFLLQEST